MRNAECGVRNDSYWMEQALQLAQKAKRLGEVPVGAILVFENKAVGKGCNQTIASSDPTAHAEIVALREGGRFFKNYRLIGTTLYVTLEPCPMCVGALIHARIQRLVFGALDTKAGAVVSVQPFEYTAGVLANPCGQILKEFFQEKRKIPPHPTLSPLL